MKEQRRGDWHGLVNNIVANDIQILDLSELFCRNRLRGDWQALASNIAEELQT